MPRDFESGFIADVRVCAGDQSGIRAGRNVVVLFVGLLRSGGLGDRPIRSASLLARGLRKPLKMQYIR